MSLGKKSKIIISSLIGLVLLPATVFAEAAISQGFTTNEQLQPGTIVSLLNNEKSIEQASFENVEKLLGVVSDTSLLELANDNTTQVQVVTNGRTQVLVSDINGNINSGDFLTASPLKGIGMKAVESGKIIGAALVDSKDLKNMYERTITDKTGTSRSVRIGMMPVQIDVANYVKPDEKKSIIPQFIVNIAQAVSGKEVSVLRVLAALLVLLVGTIAIGVMLSASVRSSIDSIGRNPLAASAVNRGLIEISLLTLGIMIIMLGAVYLILVL
jgi:hypothetical protein